jgi:hypothetical protein
MPQISADCFLVVKDLCESVESVDELSGTGGMIRRFRGFSQIFCVWKDLCESVESVDELSVGMKGWSADFADYHRFFCVKVSVWIGGICGWIESVNEEMIRRFGGLSQIILCESICVNRWNLWMNWVWGMEGWSADFVDYRRLFFGWKYLCESVESVDELSVGMKGWSADFADYHRFFCVKGSVWIGGICGWIEWGMKIWSTDFVDYRRLFFGWMNLCESVESVDELSVGMKGWSADSEDFRRLYFGVEGSVWIGGICGWMVLVFAMEKLVRLLLNGFFLIG